MRVLIVDDHTLFADAIAIQLEDVGMEVVGRATNGADAVQEALRTDPDVVLMDLALPDQSGLSAGRTILEQRPTTRLVVLTALEDRAVADEALRLGFRGYLTKDTPVARFVEAIGSEAKSKFTGKIDKVTVEIKPMMAPEKAEAEKGQKEAAHKKAASD